MNKTQQRDQEMIHAATLEGMRETIKNLRAENSELKSEVERLRDLVRYQRSALHEAELISDEEYAELAADGSAVARLEGYDEIRIRMEKAEAETKRLALKLIDHCVCRVDESGNIVHWCAEHAAIRNERDKQKQKADDLEWRLETIMVPLRAAGSPESGTWEEIVDWVRLQFKELEQYKTRAKRIGQVAPCGDFVVTPCGEATFACTDCDHIIDNNEENNS